MNEATRLTNIELAARAYHRRRCAGRDVVRWSFGSAARGVAVRILPRPDGSTTIAVGREIGGVVVAARTHSRYTRKNGKKGGVSIPRKSTHKGNKGRAYGHTHRAMEAYSKIPSSVGMMIHVM